MIRSLLLLLCLFSSCGYYFEGREKIAISVPYVQGDFEGELTDALVGAVSRSSQFRFAHGEGDWILSAKILDHSHNRIGFRYDRDDKSGKRRKNLRGTENRGTITVEVSVVNATTGKLILGPQVIESSADYDYVDQNSLLDLSFIDAAGDRQTSIAFSLGQLDSVAAAGEDALYPTYDQLAQRIIDGLIAAGD